MIVLKYGRVQSFKLEPGQFGHNKPTQRGYKPESISRWCGLAAATPTGHVEHLYVPRRRVFVTGRKKYYVARYPNFYYLGVGG